MSKGLIDLTPDYSHLISTLDTVEETRLAWLWAGLIPRGKVTVLDGDPNLGKSLLTLDLIARTVMGRAMPLRKRAPRSSRPVVLVCAEDDLGDTIKPRLRAASVDQAGMRRIRFIKVQRDAQTQKVIPLAFPDSVEIIRQAIRPKRGEVASLLVIDPIMAYMGENVKTNVDSSVRAALMPLVEVAQDTNCAALLVRHLNKNGDLRAAYRGGGSIAFTALARSALVVERHPDMPGVVVLAQIKQNLARALPGSFTYRKDSWEEDESIPVIEWGERIDMDADTLLRGPDSRKDAPERERCWDDMRTLFEEQDPWPSTKLELELQNNGHSKVMIKRTKKYYGVRSVRVYKDGKVAYWECTLKPLKLVTKTAENGENGPRASS